MELKYAMTIKELKRRTSKQAYKPVKFLSRESKELKKLTKLLKMETFSQMKSS